MSIGFDPKKFHRRLTKFSKETYAETLQLGLRGAEMV